MAQLDPLRYGFAVLPSIVGIGLIVAYFGSLDYATVFAAAPGAIIGPVQSDFGWIVVKVDSAKTEGGKTLAAVGTLTAADLKLPVDLYDPEKHYREVRDKWFGLNASGQ